MVSLGILLERLLSGYTPLTQKKEERERKEGKKKRERRGKGSKERRKGGKEFNNSCKVLTTVLDAYNTQIYKHYY